MRSDLASLAALLASLAQRPGLRAAGGAAPAGRSWRQAIYGRVALAPAEALSLAQALAGVLAALEADELAHAALSGATLLLPAEPDGCLIELIGLGRLYGPELAAPAPLPPRPNGYGLPGEPNAWGPTADRRAGGILLAELLGWGDGRVRAAAWEQSYFAPPEVGQPSERYELLRRTIALRWSPPAAVLLDAVWRAPTLEACPALHEWLAVLPRPSAELTQVRLEAEAPGDRSAAFAALLAQAEAHLAAGQREAALALLRQARGLLPVDDPRVAQAQALIHEVARS